MHPRTFPPCAAILWTPVSFTDMMLPPLSFQNRIVGLHVFSFSASNITMALVAGQFNVCFITTKGEAVDALVLRCLWSFPRKGLVSLRVLIFKPTLCSVSTWFLLFFRNWFPLFTAKYVHQLKTKAISSKKGTTALRSNSVYTLQLSWTYFQGINQTFDASHFLIYWFLGIFFLNFQKKKKQQVDKELNRPEWGP